MHHDVMLNALLFLALAVVIIPLCRFVRVSPVLGYLLVGSAVGPFGFALVEGNEGTAFLAEMGIVFLLFMIGLELSWDRLKVIRLYVFGMGTAQVAVTAALGTTIFMLLGLSAMPATLLGLALAFSSTAFVLQILSERGELSSQVGRISVAVLVLQDLAVVPLLVLIPLLGESQSAIFYALGRALLEATVAILLIFLVARFALRFVFRAVAATHAPEAFIAAALFAVIGTSFATDSMGLSYSLGAFLAGVMVASTEYRHQVEADLGPVRGLLMGLFFLTVGMTVNPVWIVSHLQSVAIGVTALMGLKAAVIFGLARAFRVPWPRALHLGVLLSQGGEFAFVVLARATEANLIGPESTEGLTSIIAVSMALTPLMAVLGSWMARSGTASAAPDTASMAPSADEVRDLDQHVILVGYGRVGHTVSTILEERGIPFIVIDNNPHFVARLRGQGRPVFFGDVRKLTVLRSIGIDRARALVLTLGEVKLREQIVPPLRSNFPDLQILSRARDRRQARVLENLGVDATVPEILEGSLQLAGLVLRGLGTPGEEVTDLLNDYRQNDYARLVMLPTSIRDEDREET